MENKNPQDVANMLANLLTPDVINKLLESKITAKKPTKKQYLEKLAENVTCFNTFIENIELEDDAIETLKQIGAWPGKMVCGPVPTTSMNGCPSRGISERLAPSLSLWNMVQHGVFP